MSQRYSGVFASLVKRITRNRDQQDCRSERFVAMINCILDQNVRDSGAASFPAMNFELLQLCHRFNVGIQQMPCPEIFVLGPQRERPPGIGLRDALDTDKGRRQCAELANEVVDRIETRLTQGSELLAIIGGNPRSPGCAVHNGTESLRAESGIFMKALQAEMRHRGHDPVFIAMRDSDSGFLQEDLALFERLLAAPRASEKRF